MSFATLFAFYLLTTFLVKEADLALAACYQVMLQRVCSLKFYIYCNINLINWKTPSYNPVLESFWRIAEWGEGSGVMKPLMSTGLSRIIIRDSSGYRSNLPVSCTVHQISHIKSNLDIYLFNIYLIFTLLKEVMLLTVYLHHVEYTTLTIH